MAERTTRHKTKRKMEQDVAKLATINLNMVGIAEMYSDADPVLAANLIILSDAIELIINMYDELEKAF